MPCNLETKRCPKCKETKQIAEFSGSYCRPCMLAYKREKYRNDESVRHKAIESAARYAAANADKVAAYQAAYREEHRGDLNAAACQYRIDKADVIREKDKIRSKDPKRKASINTRRKERIRTDPVFADSVRRSARKAGRKYYHNHKTSILERCKQERITDPEKIRERTRRSVRLWNKRHPEEAAAIKARRSAMRRGALVEGFNDAEHYTFLEQWQQTRCYHCDSTLELKKYHRDHLVPVDLGGRHEASNLALTCSWCNESKGKKRLWQEWEPKLTYSLPIVISLEPLVISTFAASERGSKNAKHVFDCLSRPAFFDWEWIHRRSAIDNILAARSGDASVIGARNTEVVEVDTEDARDFFDQYHIQGFGRGTIYLGLVYNNELVAVSSWLDGEGVVELNRLAFKGRVRGGFSKLVSHARRDIIPTGMPISSFVDMRYADGHSYEKIGFEDAGLTASPVYYYVGPGGLFHRRLFTKELLKKRFVLFDEALSEKDNAMMNGYYRVYGVRQRRFLLK